MRLLILLWLISLTLPTQAQQRKPDVIYLRNSTRIKGYVVSILERQIQYRLSLKKGTPILTTPRYQVAVIRYGTGRVFHLSPKVTSFRTTQPSNSAASVKFTETTVKPSTISWVDSTSRQNKSSTPLANATPSKSDEPPQQVVTIKQTNQSYHKFSLFVHASGAQLAGTSDWTDATDGIGFKQGIGANVQAQFRFNKKLAVALTGSYTNWQVLRNFLSPDDQQTLVGWKYGLTHLSGLFSMKIYPVGSAYVAPEAGITLVQYQLQQVYQGITDVPITYQIFTPVAGISIGSEAGLGILRLDINAFGCYVFNHDSDHFRPQSMTQIGLRLGIGLSSIMSK